MEDENKRSCHRAAYLLSEPRNKLWRKVNVRMAFLGWNTVDLLRGVNGKDWDALSKPEKATKRSVFCRKLNTEKFSEAELRMMAFALNIKDEVLLSSRTGFSTLVK